MFNDTSTILLVVVESRWGAVKKGCVVYIYHTALCAYILALQQVAVLLHRCTAAHMSVAHTHVSAFPHIFPSAARSGHLSSYHIITGSTTYIDHSFVSSPHTCGPTRSSLYSRLLYDTNVFRFIFCCAFRACEGDATDSFTLPVLLLYEQNVRKGHTYLSPPSIMAVSRMHIMRTWVLKNCRAA